MLIGKIRNEWEGDGPKKEEVYKGESESQGSNGELGHWQKWRRDPIAMWVLWKFDCGKIKEFPLKYIHFSVRGKVIRLKSKSSDSKEGHIWGKLFFLSLYFLILRKVLDGQDMFCCLWFPSIWHGVNREVLLVTSNMTWEADSELAIYNRKFIVVCILVQHLYEKWMKKGQEEIFANTAGSFGTRINLKSYLELGQRSRPSYFLHWSVRRCWLIQGRGHD